MFKVARSTRLLDGEPHIPRHPYFYQSRGDQLLQPLRRMTRMRVRSPWQYRWFIVIAVWSRDFNSATLSAVEHGCSPPIVYHIPRSYYGWRVIPRKTFLVGAHVIYTYLRHHATPYRTSSGFGRDLGPRPRPT